VTGDEADATTDEGGPGGGRAEEGQPDGGAGGDSASRGEFLGGTGNPPEADRSLADPAEHPEQHAALHTGGQAAEPQEETDNTLLDSEEHSDAGGSFGTADQDEDDD
jgi:hypothetical protein